MQDLCCFLFQQYPLMNNMIQSKIELKQIKKIELNFSLIYVTQQIFNIDVSLLGWSYLIVNDQYNLAMMCIKKQFMKVMFKLN